MFPDWLKCFIIATYIKNIFLAGIYFSLCDYAKVIEYIAWTAFDIWLLNILGLSNIE